MKLSIITPVYNGAAYISQTIESVLDQKGEFVIEYIIVDGCSTDGTSEIIKNYQKELEDGTYSLNCLSASLQLISGKDENMYDAINKGFRFATGDVYAWINADDIYLPGAFDSIFITFTKFPDMHWLKGITSYISSTSTMTRRGCGHNYVRSWIELGLYGREAYFIQQDSVFWRSWLWDRAGGIQVQYSVAGDYYLWIQFAKLTPLYTVNLPVSCFRRVDGQLSQDTKRYIDECEKISPRSGLYRRSIGYFWRRTHSNSFQFIRKLMTWIFLGFSRFHYIEVVGDEPLLCSTINYRLPIK